jgi:hypothetical protein
MLIEAGNMVVGKRVRIDLDVQAILQEPEVLA